MRSRDQSSWLGLQSAHLGFPPLENLPDRVNRDDYQLLCRDMVRKPVEEYKECHLALVPSHAIVARSVDGKEDLIWELLNRAQVSPPTVLPSCLGVPAWIWGIFLNTVLATLEVLLDVGHSRTHGTHHLLH